MAAPALSLVLCMLLLSHGSAQARKTVPGEVVPAADRDGASGRERFLGGGVEGAAGGSRRRRELLAGAGATTTRDVFAPVTNPVTVNPGTGTGSATNPNLPPLYPEPSTTPDPTTMPAPFSNPVAAPTMPAPFTAPVTNPATTPTPAPATTVPTPTTVQPAAGGTGQSTWCVAKAGVTEAALQDGLDYACGMGGADCSALQPMGSCYNPNTMQAHASYAFNAYYQRSPSPASCDFGGAGMLVATNPSSGTCMYQASSGSGSAAGYSPAATGTTSGPVGVTPSFGPVGTTTGTGTGPAVSSGGSGSTVLNANNYPGGTSMYGPGNPAGFSDTSSGAASLNCSWVLSLIWMFTFAYVKVKV
ncbi:unnamed protein product [Triticum turgidum subsp. durum]|uniref:X8 domain-containing protein n=1 Tax=Triticum turgidum subsp. durum TaxID=4567 RepID=A0A9R0W3M2_TRITD|nr:unnamed protein product [Triticum turgidum subsp. durum]